MAMLTNCSVLSPAAVLSAQRGPDSPSKTWYYHLMKWVDFLATGFGSGYFPKGPGTAGTVVGVPLVVLFALPGPTGYIALTISFIVFSIFVAQAYELTHEGHDRKEVVIDEMAGFLVTMAILPLTWQTLLLGFVLFRFFDILKPFPISYLDKRIKGGFGVVVDDLVAGLFANIILHQIFS